VLATGAAFSDIENIIMEEARISALCSLGLKVDEGDGEKDMVR
jgi:hypothetical protein